MSELLKIISDKKSCYSQIREYVRNHPSQVNSFDRAGMSPLHLAILRGDYLVANILLVWGADPNVKNTNEETPLHLAAKMGNYELVHLLVENNAQIDAHTIEGRTPLHYVATQKESNESIRVAELLLDYGAYLNAKDAFVMVPLDYARKAGNVAIQDLLESGLR